MTHRGFDRWAWLAAQAGLEQEGSYTRAFVTPRSGPSMELWHLPTTNNDVLAHTLNVRLVQLGINHPVGCSRSISANQPMSMKPHGSATRTRTPRRRSSANASAIDATIPSSCRIVVEAHHEVTMFCLHGEVDAVTAPEVREFLDSALGKPAVVLDLTEVRFIDAAGLHALRDVILGVHGQGGFVALARPRRTSKLDLQLVGTPGLVFLAFSVDGAREWLEQHSQRELWDGLPATVLSMQRSTNETAERSSILGRRQTLDMRNRQ